MKRILSWFNKIMMAVTFAEAGEQGRAVRLIEDICQKAINKSQGPGHEKNIFPHELRAARTKP